MLMSTESPYHFAHLLQVLKHSLWNMILNIFKNYFIHVYSPRAGTDNPLGTKFWCQQKFLITLPICCQVKKKSLWSLIFYCFFPHVYSRRQGQTTHWGQKNLWQQKAFSLCPYVAKFQNDHFDHLLQDSNKSLWILILYTFLNDSHMYIAPGQRQTILCGQNSDVNRKALPLCPFVASFKRNIFDVWF